MVVFRWPQDNGPPTLKKPPTCVRMEPVITDTMAKRTNHCATESGTKALMVGLGGSILLINKDESTKVHTAIISVVLT